MLFLSSQNEVDCTGGSLARARSSSPSGPWPAVTALPERRGALAARRSCSEALLQRCHPREPRCKIPASTLSGDDDARDRKAACRALAALTSVKHCAAPRAPGSVCQSCHGWHGGVWAAPRLSAESAWTRAPRPPALDGSGCGVNSMIPSVTSQRAANGPDGVASSYSMALILEVLGGRDRSSLHRTGTHLVWSLLRLGPLGLRHLQQC
jgi:hypothetical protein